ncbi:MAG: GTPase Era [Helicobacteraceae bacterium]|jgi:GTP-binding protein Era|nr:GTPase Era [Helicobacteraceae bacterium]
MRRDISSKAGFVAVIGRPNAGKSTLINAMLKERIALVSRKAGATRKRQKAIVTYKNAQIVLIDTPGIEKRGSKLDEFMQKEMTGSLQEADLVYFLADMADDTADYERFLTFCSLPHIVVLTKMDNFTFQERLRRMARYQPFADRFLSLVPVSAKKGDFTALLEETAKRLPKHSFYYNSDELTDQSVREICKEMIREALFDKLSDEVPYSADVIIDSFSEGQRTDKISARVIVEKESQKAIAIGRGGSAIKRVGSRSRELIERFLGKRVFLSLSVETMENWRNGTVNLAKFGYDS